MPIPPKKKSKIKDKIGRWIKHNYERLKDIDPSELAPNPFLLRALGIKEDSQNAKEFAIRQRVERSLVTSFGSLFQEILKALGFEEAEIPDIDLKITKDKTLHLIQLKSGPEGFTGTALRATLERFETLKKELGSKIKPVVAFAYGSREALSPVWGEKILDAESEGKILLLVGKEFWEYFFGKGTYEELLDMFELQGKEIIGSDKGIYQDIIEHLSSKLKS